MEDADIRGWYELDMPVVAVLSELCDAFIPRANASVYCSSQAEMKKAVKIKKKKKKKK
jgi:hypothetical protein